MGIKISPMKLEVKIYYNNGIKDVFYYDDEFYENNEIYKWFYITQYSQVCKTKNYNTTILLNRNIIQKIEFTSKSEVL